MRRCSIEDMLERDYFLPFSVFPGIGHVRFKKLLDFFGSAKNIWEASDVQVVESGLGKSLSKQFVGFRESFSIDTFKKKLDSEKIDFVVSLDKDYPKSLKDLSDFPFLFYIKGNRKLLSKNFPKISVVGTRMITQYGRDVTTFFCREFSRNGVVIVSGLALGVDAISHEVALSEEAYTIAVLGSGIDECYPRSNQPLYREILLGKGLIL